MADFFPQRCLKQKVPRSVGEKKRRDRLNSLLSTLAEENPFVVNSCRRLDKTAILRLTVSYMKLHHGLKRKRLQKVLDYNLNEFPFSGLFEKVVNGSLLVVSERGEILFVSPNISEITGHYQTDLVGHNIENFIHPDDLTVFRSQFQERVGPSSGTVFATFQKDEHPDRPSNMELLETENFSMCIRLSKAVKRRYDGLAPKEFELFNLRGHIDKPMVVDNSKFDDSGTMWMVAILRPVGNQAIREVSVAMSEFLKNNEWASQHGLDGKIWTIDHRGTLFHGYMASEVLGNTPYVFIKDEDLKYVARSHQLIMRNNEIPSTVFRMKNRYNIDLYVQSRSIIVNDSWSKKPKCIVSVNTRLSKEEGIILLEEQRKRVEKLIAQTELLAISESDLKQDTLSETDNDSNHDGQDIKENTMNNISDDGSGNNSSPISRQSSSSSSPFTSSSCASLTERCESPDKILHSVVDHCHSHDLVAQGSSCIECRNSPVLLSHDSLLRENTASISSECRNSPVLLSHDSLLRENTASISSECRNSPVLLSHDSHLRENTASISSECRNSPVLLSHNSLLRENTGSISSDSSYQSSYSAKRPRKSLDCVFNYKNDRIENLPFVIDPAQTEETLYRQQLSDDCTCNKTHLENFRPCTDKSADSEKCFPHLRQLLASKGPNTNCQGSGTRPPIHLLHRIYQLD